MGQQLKSPRTFLTAFEDYQATEILGEGGAGRVYGGMDSTGSGVAIKVLKTQAASRERRKRFRNECEFCRQNRHPNIIRVLADGVDISGEGPNPFFVMPRYPHTLRTLAHEGLTAEQRMGVFLKILNGVEAAHLQGIIHRDLKPENILCTNGGEEVVVADFGIAHFTEDFKATAVETKASTRLANFLYAAPEQRKPGQTVRDSADIYALGLILNELFTGQVAQGTDYARISDSSPEYGPLDEVVDQMLRQDPKQRIASVEIVKQQLRQALAVRIARQEFDQLSRRVVDSATVTDPLATDPPKIESVDWRDGKLYITLDREVSDNWVYHFRRLESWQDAVLGAEPPDWSFKRNRVAYIEANEHTAQQILNSFKPWPAAASAQYRRQLEEAERRRQAREEAELRYQKEQSKKRETILRKLQF